MSPNNDQRKVRFNGTPEIRYVKQVNDMKKEDREATWIANSDSDFHRKAEKACDRVSERLRARVSRGFVNVFDSLEDSEGKAQDKLHRLCKECPSLRGLERLALPEHECQRAKHRQQVVFTVFYAQKAFTNTEQLARAAKLFSKKDVKFAQAMAIIDACNVENDEAVVTVEQPRPESNSTTPDQMHLDHNLSFESEPIFGMPDTARSESQNSVPSTIYIDMNSSYLTPMAA
mmetsp:Transcript_5305/g.7801  ORF Transcript_5305/g.7801 Transcript_5305/m.7801 type:complete len:231 (-) Transcript_5305:301-993(-)